MTSYMMNSWLQRKRPVWAFAVVSVLGAKCERVGGGAGDGGRHRRSRALHPRQRVGSGEGPCSPQLEQPNLHPPPQRPATQFRIPPTTLSRWAELIQTFMVPATAHLIYNDWQRNLHLTWSQTWSTTPLCQQLLLDVVFVLSSCLVMRQPQTLISAESEKNLLFPHSHTDFW